MTRKLAHSKTVLLVDDLDALRKMVRDFLESRGVRVLEAWGAAQAIHAVRSASEDIDLLLTDVEMPGMSGWDAAREIAGIRPGIRILFMSAGMSLEEWQHRPEKATGAYFVAKPFRLEELKDLVMAILCD